MSVPKVMLFLLGGTITMAKSPKTKSGVTSGVAPAMDVISLCRAVPGLDQVAEIEARTDHLLASVNLTFQHVIDLASEITQAAQKGAVDGFVIIQGTDTLEEVAFLLDCLVNIKQPIVITGAMRNPSQLSADGPANILAAVTCAATRAVGQTGVVVVLNDDIHSAQYVCKTHTGNVAAFQSPNSGPIGRVVEGRVRLFSFPVQAPKIAAPTSDYSPNIALIKVGFADDSYMLNLIENANCDGLVIEGFGAGHIPEKGLDILDLLIRKMPVILSSRINAGHVMRQTYGFKGAEIDLIQRGVIPSGILDGLKARILLSLLVMSGSKHNEIKQAFERWDM